MALPNDLKHKVIVASICNYFSQQLRNPQVGDDEKESLDVCLDLLRNTSNFNDASLAMLGCVDLNKSAGDKVDSIAKCDQLEAFYKTYLSSCKPVSEQNRLKAEALKEKGNAFMANQQEIREAVKCYDEAMNLNPANAVYYSNRAAANTSIGDYKAAITDCKLALVADPNFAKAYSRLGVAYSKCNKLQLALQAAEKAVSMEPTNERFLKGLEKIKELVSEGGGGRSAETNSGSVPPPPQPGAGMFGPGGMENLLSNFGLGGMGAGLGGAGMGGAAAGGAPGAGAPGMGGMFDGLLNSGSLQSMFSDPSVMQSVAQAMQNPEMQNMVQNMMGSFSQNPNFMNAFGGAPPSGNPPPNNDQDKKDDDSKKDDGK